MEKMKNEKEARKVLKSIGYDNDSITPTELWIAHELTKKHERKVRKMQKEIDRLIWFIRNECSSETRFDD